MSLKNHELCAHCHVCSQGERRQSSTRIVLLLSELFLYADHISGILAIKKHWGHPPCLLLHFKIQGCPIGPNRGICSDLTYFHFLLYPYLHFTDQEIQVQNGYIYIYLPRPQSQSEHDPFSGTGLLRLQQPFLTTPWHCLLQQINRSLALESQNSHKILLVPGNGSQLNEGIFPGDLGKVL